VSQCSHYVDVECRFSGCYPVMLGVVMLNVIMLSVMAPTVACGISHQKPQKQMLSGLLKNVLVLSMEEYQL